MTLIPVTPQSLGNKRLKPVSDYAFVAKQPFCEIFAAEFASVAISMPIFFMENQGRTMPVALFALQQQDNLFVEQSGGWAADYIPAMLRVYPFVVGQDQAASKPVLLLDDASGLLSDTEGEPLYGEGKEGELSGVVGRAVQLISQMEGQSAYTSDLVGKVVKTGIIEPTTINYRHGGEQKSATGMLWINQQKFAALPDQTILELKHGGALPLIYAHFLSLGLLPRLEARLAARG